MWPNAPGTPCAGKRGAQLGQRPASPATGGGIQVGPAGAYTDTTSSANQTTGPVAPAATSLASVDSATIPTPDGSIVIVGPVQAQASYSCVNGSLKASSRSNRSVLEIAGQTISLPTPGAPDTISLGGGSYVAVNQNVAFSNSETERVLDVHLAGVGDVVLGEGVGSEADASPCAGTSGEGRGLAQAAQAAQPEAVVAAA